MRFAIALGNLQQPVHAQAIVICLGSDIARFQHGFGAPVQKIAERRLRRMPCPIDMDCLECHAPRYQGGCAILGSLVNMEKHCFSASRIVRECFGKRWSLNTKVVL
jgi:hypothetical protein